MATATAAQFGFAAAVLLLAVWEIGKLVVRRQVSTTDSPVSGSSSAPPGLVADF